MYRMEKKRTNFFSIIWEKHETFQDRPTLKESRQVLKREGIFQKCLHD